MSLKQLPQRFIAVSIVILAAVMIIGLCRAGAAQAQTLPQVDTHTEPGGGTFVNYQPAGPSSETGAFFQALGTNGRTCETCHEPADAFGLSLADIQSRPLSDPLFAAVDGADCLDQPTSHNLLLNYGLIRVMLPISPVTFTGATPNYVIKVLKDPTNCQLNNPNVQAACVQAYGPGAQCISVYRRPLPTTNMSFQSVLFWDGRVPSPQTIGLTAALNQVDIHATETHEQTGQPTAAQLADMAAFQEGLYSTQETDAIAGSLTANGATESAQNLANITAPAFYYGINQPLTPGFNVNAMTFFNAWSSLTGTDPVSLQEESIARGEGLFNDLRFRVGPNPKNISGCTGCHNDPNVGDASDVPVLMTQVANDAPNDPTLETGNYLPEFSIACPGKNQPVTLTTDPGQVLIDGNCNDVRKVKTPTLHALLAHPPYFRSGAAATLQQVVTFYNVHFNIGMTAQQQTDMVNFLGAL
ncbi:MAG TPA: hypothetical protein VFB15_10790 [Candidatus Binataceae bacterium]|nr:hypothetical protein [Candidatus Binataceae bacterium]